MLKIIILEILWCGIFSFYVESFLKQATSFSHLLVPNDATYQLKIPQHKISFIILFNVRHHKPNYSLGNFTYFLILQLILTGIYILHIHMCMWARARARARVCVCVCVGRRIYVLCNIQISIT
jgi:hypothetical protein